MENFPKIIEGALSVDDRGQVAFANDFNFEGVKRFYAVEAFSTSTIRAWHGHLIESKYVFVAAGSAIIGAVEMTDPSSPDKNKTVHRFILSSRKPAVLFIPSGFANGFRALESNTKIIFFSTSSLEETKSDDYRFAADYWGTEVWEVKNR